MLRHFSGAEEDNRYVHAVAAFKNRVIFYVYFTQRSAELAQDRRDGKFSLLTQMAAWARVKGHLALARGSQAGVLRVLRHGFGLEYFWNGPACG